MKTTDTTGKTLDTARADARRLQTQHEAGGVNLHLRATLGRLRFSARRWGWAVRFYPVGQAPASHDVGQGVRWEAVEQM